jgi:hypothetical protein
VGLEDWIRNDAMVTNFVRSAPIIGQNAATCWGQILNQIKKIKISFNFKQLKNY